MSFNDCCYDVQLTCPSKSTERDHDKIHNRTVPTCAFNFMHIQNCNTQGIILNILPTAAAVTSPCTSGDVRLSNTASGRVEFCVNQQFGTVCDAGSWDKTDAQVVCSQLGYGTTGMTLNLRF